MTLDLLNREGELVINDDGQLVFRLTSSKCSSCTGSCQRGPVREFVISSVMQSEGNRHRAVLCWTRRDASRAGIRIYGPPVAGLLLALVASVVADFSDGMAEALTFCGMAAGMFLARCLGFAWRPDRLPELSGQRISNNE